jgi:hypothetical protein
MHCVMLTASHRYRDRFPLITPDGECQLYKRVEYQVSIAPSIFAFHFLALLCLLIYIVLVVKLMTLGVYKQSSIN